MLRPLMAAFSLALAVALAAGAARADDLQILVERTAALGEPIEVIVLSDTPGRVEVTAAPLAEDADDKSVRLAATLPGSRFAGADYSTAGQRQRVAIPADRPGRWAVEVRRGGRTARLTALVSDLALVTKRHPGGLLAWAVNRTTGRSWPGTEVVLSAAGREIARGVTDAEGLVRFAGDHPPTVEVKARADEHVAFGPDTWYPSGSSDRRVYAFPHQPAYRPGERVEVRGVVRAVQQGRFVLDPTLAEVGLRLLPPTGEAGARTTAPLSADLGTFSAGFDLSAEAPTGRWTLVVEAGGDEYAAPVVVEAYRKPAIEVSVEPTPARVLAGEPLEFALQASFYDGGVVAGARVEWQLVWNRVDREIFPTEEIVRLFFGTEREAFEPVTLATGSGTTGPDGRMTVPARAPPEALDGWLSLRAVVTGPDGIAVAGSGGAAVAAAPIAVALKPDRRVYGPEDTARVAVRVELADGRPAPDRRGVLSVGLSSPPEAGQPPEERILHLVPFTTDASGETVVEAPLGMDGRYALAVAVERLPTEPPGPPALSVVGVYAVGDRTTIGHSGEALEVIADRDDYAVGDRAKILVLSPAGGRPALATLEGARLLGEKVLDLGGNAALWTVEVTEDLVPNAYLVVACVDRGNLVHGQRMLRVPPRTRVIETAILPDSAELAPGASVGVSFQVTDSEGRPVTGAEVSLSVVDDALYALHPDPAAAIEAFFHPPRRNEVTTGLLHHRASAASDVSARVAKLEERAEGGMAGADAAEAPSADPGAPPPEALPVPSPAPHFGGGVAHGEAAPSEEAPRDRETDADSPYSARGYSGPGKSKDGPSAPEPVVRGDFRTCAFWAPSIRTDREGRARIDEIRFGESLTRWRLSARTVDADTRVGTAAATVRTRLEVSARLSPPRFLRADDAVSVPLLLKNLTERPIDASYRATDGTWVREGEERLGAGAVLLLRLEHAAGPPGIDRLLAEVRSAAGSDAEQREVPVLPQGIEKVVGAAALVAAPSGGLELEIPDHAERGTISAHISVEPAVVAAVAAALPYLADYPYGCTEQTMSRFVPVLAAADAAAALKVPSRGLLAEVPRMVEAGIQRLAALQHADGGFGWWPNDPTDAGMTALVVRGLNYAVRRLPEGRAALGIRERAAARLAAMAEAGEVRDPATLASACLALAYAERLGPDLLLKALDDASVYASSPLTRALFLRAARKAGLPATVVGELQAGLLRDALRQGSTVHWEPAPGAEGTERWQDDAVETTAEVLLALLEGTEGEVLEAGARWLLLARRGGDRWQSTRDTAAAVRYLVAHAMRTGDLGVGRTIEVLLDGAPLGTVTPTPEGLFDGSLVLAVPAERLVPGARLRVEGRTSRGELTLAASVRFHETGPAIEASDHGFTVTRRWFRLDPEDRDGRAFWKRTPVTETVPAGTLLESEVSVSSPRAREYAMVVDPLAAGFEPAREVAMEVVGRAEAAEAEVQRYDDRTVFFVTRLPAGTSVFRHVVRATHRGRFTALPAQALLMYFPEVRGNSAGEPIEVGPEDAPSGVPAAEGGR